MITFKQFLSEAAVANKPDYKSVEVEHAIAILNTYCKNALWMLIEDRPIYRGDPDTGPHKALSKSGFAAVDTTATERKSQNTSNWYTLILDNHPDRKGFPLRSRCFIASTDKNRARDYTGWGSKSHNLIRVIPADDAKIGLVNQEDMWDTRVKLFGSTGDIESWNNCFGELLGAKVSFESLVGFDKLLKAGDDAALKKFRKVFSLGEQTAKEIAAKGFLNEVMKAYSAESTGHQAVNTATMPHKYSGEVWVGGKVVMITPKMWEQLRAAL